MRTSTSCHTSPSRKKLTLALRVATCALVKFVFLLAVCLLVYLGLLECVEVREEGWVPGLCAELEPLELLPAVGHVRTHQVKLVELGRDHPT